MKQLAQTICGIVTWIASGAPTGWMPGGYRRMIYKESYLATATQPFVTVSEYLRLEAEAPFKSEWIDGQIVAMAGGTEMHSLISINVAGELRQRLRGSGCRVYGADMMTRTAPEGIHSYPDAMVVCGPSIVSRNVILTNPRIIVEVLSKSTANYDRGEKFVRYREIPSFEDYLLVSQTEMLVEHHHKEAPGVWIMHEHKGAGRVIRFESIGIELPFSEIYRDVRFTDSDDAADSLPPGFA